VTAAIPEDLRDLVDRPLFAALGTIRPDTSVQVNPMWFDFDGEHIRFTHTTYRQKYRNLQRNPAMSLLIVDPADPERYLELRGELAKVEPDPEGDFFVHLGRRYGNADSEPPEDAADRVILHMRIRRTARG
jgi:PPOX class probable F420-dependent enzyme